MPDDYQVIWNGRVDHPGGRQLFAEEWEPITADNGRMRRLGDIDEAERMDIRYDLSTFGLLETARRHRISREMVQVIARMGTA